MNNIEILKHLEDEYGSASAVKTYLSQWNKDESQFPIEEVFRYIQFNTWEVEEFSFRVENIIRKVLPDYMLDVFFKVKEFKSNSRNELLPCEEVYAKVMGFPAKTQDDKAFVTYRYHFHNYYERSKLKGKESINVQDLYTD